MTTKTFKLRAFPRLSCGRPARLVFPDMEEVGQVVDVSAGGSKFMPFHLEVLAAWGMPPGISVKVEICTTLIPASIVWATPNYSAIGCRFDNPLAPEQLAAILDVTGRGVIPGRNRHFGISFPDAVR